MLGNAGQKITRIVDLAEELYERVVELREQVRELRETTQDTHDRVVDLEDEVAAQREVLEALAEAEGIDTSELGAVEDTGAEAVDGSAESTADSDR